MSTSANNKPVALITGAAGGIGRAIAAMLAKQGYLLALADINEEGLEKLSGELGPGHLTYPNDITDYNKVCKMIENIHLTTGRIDVMVNNAGMVVIKPFIDCSIEDLKSEIDLNYMAALYCIKTVLPYMQKAGSGVIVSVSSLGAITPMAVSPNYTASKAALRGLMLALNLTLAPHGIHAGCVCPSAVDTKMLEMEALGGGSLLNFLQKPLAPEAVAAAVWQVIDKNKIEVCIPGSEGVSSKLGAFFPALFPKILPHLEKIGERKRLTYIRSKKPAG